MALPYNGTFKITSPQGMRTLGGVTAEHRGLDLVGLTDKHICAVRAGVVVRSRRVDDPSDATSQWGEYVAVRGLDGLVCYYCHMSARLVTEGQKVAEGDHLGVEGSTGYSTGSHLHFEVRGDGGTPVSAAEYIGFDNAVGVVALDYRAEAQRRFGFDEATMEFLDRHPFANDLYFKFARK